MLLGKSYGTLVGTAILIFVTSHALPAQSDSIYRLPAGTVMTLKLDDELSSRFSTAGDTFIAKVARPVTVRDVVVVPAGTKVEGRVSAAKTAATGGRPGDMSLSFLSLLFSGGTACEIDGSLHSKLVAEKRRSFSYLGVFGGAGIGALLGGLTGSGRNVLIGTAVGAGAGTIAAASQKGSDVSLARNVEFEIELKREVVLPVLDY